MTRTAPRFRTLGLWLVACALAVRLVVAPGFMPVADANGFTIAMCSGQGAASIHIPGKSTPAMPGSGGCAFASLAVATAPDVPAVLAAPVILAPVAQVPSPLVRAPHIGVPAPPPPAIGPPSLI
ncbi:hypothetical protein [Sphingomonas sp. SUN039]|uniref:hypothetical protein n=1 Tax=Sphingomonas sp. SUN039 TaxID=2937787 RepID=UPI0021647568|nr:hypothetical protein [Sphingomonas sp. SUN039]UVO55556.1 hypothetical protein M0209_16050 [Sphingomonas sp. SUN039]